MIKLVSRVAGLAVLAGVAASAQAVLIDDFTSGPYSITANSVLPRAEAVRAGTMLGLERDALLGYTNGPLAITAQVLIGDGGAQFYNEASETNGFLVLQYDGIDGELETDGVQTNGGNLNANLLGGLAFEFFFPFVDAGLGNNVTITTTVVSGATTSTFSSNVLNGTNILHSQSFGNFAGINFADVDRIEFRFQSPTSADFTLDYIRTNVVPGPAALLPFLAGMAGVARRRRRASK